MADGRAARPRRARPVAAACLVALLLAARPLPAAAQAEGAPPPAESGLRLEAPSAVLMDVLTGRVLFEQGARQRRYPASITKLMTMYVVLKAIQEGRVSWDDDVVASERAASLGGTQIFLEPGEVMKLRDLFKSVAVASANDAAVALAEHVAGSVEEFVAAMNRTARELGMRDTRFANPHGLHHPDHYTTAYDVALLARALLRDFPDVTQFTRIWIDYVREGKERFQLANTNKMVAWYPGVDGLKTGWHEYAGWCVVATQQQGTTRLVAVILGHDHPRRRFAEAAALLRYGFGRYEAVPLVRAGEVLTEAPVQRGRERRVALVAPETWGVVVPKGTAGQLTRQLVVRTPVVAPVRRGDVLGTLIVRRGQEEVGRLPLVAAADVPPLSLFGLWWRLLGAIWLWGGHGDG